MIPGPVSQHLEAELRELARQHGIVVWLDKSAAYNTFADALHVRAQDGAFPWPVRRFRGSFLELMRDLDGLEDGVGAKPLVVHVPDHTPDDIRRTPLLELYRAGRSHQRALPTLIKEAAHGRATVEQIDAFLAGGQVTLESADAWLEGLSRAAGRDGPDLSALGAEALIEALLPGGTLAPALSDPATERAVWRRAQTLLGLGTDEAERRARGAQDASKQAPDSLASNVAQELVSWALSVEYVHDLKRAPRDGWLIVLATLPKPVVQTCQQLARNLRERHASLYARWADEADDLLPEERRTASADDLGQVDTFRFEDRTVLAAALAALGRDDYHTAHTWAVARQESRSFWTRQDRQRRLAWQLVELAAELGTYVRAQPKLLSGTRSHADAVERYAAQGFKVDAAHRRLEQARQQSPVLEIEELGELRIRLDYLRHVYREWADETARAWNQLCREQGFLPGAALQQRQLFDDVVRPLTQDGEATTAYFMVDGLRYEMAAQLAQSLQETKTASVSLSARLAELPTVTEVGMNVLAPLAREGKLQPDINERGEIRGFRSSEARISVPDDRRKAIHERVGGKTCPRLSLEEVLDRDVTKLRRAIAEARLVIVHCEGIDKSGEKGVGLSVFERELQYLRSAWRQLFEAGVRRFVFAADHGFLIHDPITRAPIVHGFKTVPKRRHVVSFDHLDRPEEVAIDAASLGYETSRGTWFLVPETTAPFDVGDRAKDFVHGGNSLQERVIPVLTVIHKHAAGTSTARFAVEAKALKPVARMHCVELRVTASGQTGLAFGSAKEIELVIECIDGAGVQAQVCDARDARLTGAGVIATVDQRCEVYFRLTGPRDERVRIQVRQAGGGANVDSCSLVERFEVERTQPATVAPTSPSFENKDAWLNEMPAGGIRDVFRHISVHGSVNEAEATQMLGGARAFRKFSRELDEHAKLAPFKVRVSVVSGTKCYVRGD